MASNKNVSIIYSLIFAKGFQIPSRPQVKHVMYSSSQQHKNISTHQKKTKQNKFNNYSTTMPPLLSEMLLYPQSRTENFHLNFLSATYLSFITGMHINFQFFLANIRSRTNINKINTSQATLNQATGDGVYLKGKKEPKDKKKKRKSSFGSSQTTEGRYHKSALLLFST